MRRLLNGILKNPAKEISPTFPSLPSNFSFAELTHMNKRGFLAQKLGQYLGVSRDEGNSIFWLSLTHSSFVNPGNKSKTEFMLYLSEWMLKRAEQNKHLPEEIKRLDVGAEMQNAMLKAYDMYKNELFKSEQIVPHQKTQSNRLQDGDKWLVYRDIIFAVTQKKFLLITEDESIQHKKGTVFCEGTINQRSDIPLCRNLAKERLEQEGYHNSTIMGWLLVLSEAITNTIKHAEEGRMTLIKDEENSEVRFVIEDNGPGFSLEELPKTTLLAGYSTKKSLGQGFTLMMKMAKQVLLCTSNKGSTIILSFDSNKETKDR